MLNCKLKSLLGGLAAAAAMAYPIAGATVPLNLSNSPLFLASTVQPNIVILTDDSGSMDWGMMTGESIGLLWGPGGWWNDWSVYVFPYPIPNSATVYTNDEWQAITEQELQSIGVAPPYHGIWRARNSDYNGAYYNPRVTYAPWIGTDQNGNAYVPANPAAARYNPYLGAASPAINLTQNTPFWTFFDGAWRWVDPYYPARYQNWTDSDADGVVDATDAHTPVEVRAGNAPFTTGPGRTDCAAAPSCTYAEEIQNFANWFQYYRNRDLAAKAAMTALVAGANNVRLGYATINDNNNVSLAVNPLNSDPFSGNKAQALDRISRTRPSGGTPLRRNLRDVGRYYEGQNGNIFGASSPILPAGQGGECQQNFTVLMTDGFWNGGSPGVGNTDGDNNTAFDGGSYSDPWSETLADVAMSYYERDLAPSLANNVPTITGVDEAAHQHMVTFTVAFGLAGTLDPFDLNTPGDPSDTDPTDPAFNWPQPAADVPAAVDDLWHAGYNGRGQFLSARDPVTLANSLAAAVSDIADRTSSAASVALNSGSLNANSRLYQARFESGDWSGQLLAYAINADGSLGTVQWDAGCRITGGLCSADGQTYAGQDWNSGRQIITYKPSSGMGIPLRWPANPALPGPTELDVSQSTALGVNPASGTADGRGRDRLEFLRGRNVTGFRTRSSLLGDVIHSAPVFVDTPAFNYRDDLETQPYSAFRATYQNRTAMLYFGANDGMLHAIDAGSGATGGTERFAYVPARVFGDLNRLTDPNYTHRYYVDGNPTAGDAFFNGVWHTVLVTGLRGGGQGVFALDVTDPAQFSEANAANLALWEFTDADDGDLGFPFGRPAIVRLQNGRWAAVFGNGYNSTDDAGGTDTNVSSSGNAVLFIVDLETGAVIKKIDTGVGAANDPFGAARPNGLATPAPVDFDGDRNVDYIYAGDLFGNVWKFDVTSTNPNQWDVAYKSGATALPLFTATDGNGTPQPITSRLEVGAHPQEDGFMIYFGTGQYIETGDNVPAGAQTQTFYGIWDKGLSSLTAFNRAHLLEQQILQEVTAFGFELRVTSDNPIVWHTGSGLPSGSPPSTHLGWYMDLINIEGGNTDNLGERVVSDPILQSGTVIFTTLQPSDAPCNFGGTGWLMELDAGDGSRLSAPPFDLNNDGVFTVSDNVSVDLGAGVVSLPVSGKKSVVGIIPAPGILKTIDPTKEVKYTSGSTGAVESTVENRGAGAGGRRSWRQVQ